MNKQTKNYLVFGTIAFVMAVAVFFGINATKNLGKSTKQVNTEDARGTLDKLYTKLGEIEHAPSVSSPIDLMTEQDIASELPELTDKMATTIGRGQVNVTVFASPEKAGTGHDAWMAEMAERFNREKVQVDGQTASVTVYNITSGLGLDYITSGKETPTLYSPSSDYWGRMATAKGVSLETLEESVAGNVAGIVIKNEKYDEISKEYGTVTVQTVCQAIIDKKLIFGYTTPNTSSAGLNWITDTLHSFDAKDPLSQDAITGFQSFQQNIPFVAQTTMQMQKAAEKGSLDAFVYESQVWENSPDMQRTYKFVPYGIRHDNPVYLTEAATESQQEVAKLFMDYCKSDDAVKLATKYGFNSMNGYSPEFTDFDGQTLLSAQKMWKENKDSGKTIIAVFVADVSGSMKGDAINNLKDSLTNGMQYINEDNYVGLVTYSTDPVINCDVGKFDLNQKALFKGAVENISASGSTGTCNGLVVGLKLLVDKKFELVESGMSESEIEPMLFLLSDGDSDHGYGFRDVEGVLRTLGIPVYTINYNEGSALMNNLSEVNEAATINATSDDVVYKIRNLFNSNL